MTSGRNPVKLEAVNEAMSHRDIEVDSLKATIHNLKAENDQLKNNKRELTDMARYNRSTKGGDAWEQMSEHRKNEALWLLEDEVKSLRWQMYQEKQRKIEAGRKWEIIVSAIRESHSDIVDMIEPIFKPILEEED